MKDFPKLILGVTGIIGTLWAIELIKKEGVIEIPGLPGAPPYVPEEPKPPVQPDLPPTFSITYIPSSEDGRGTVSPLPGDYPAYSVISLSAVPDAGSKFVRWVINGFIFTDNPVKIKMDRRYEIQADFIKISSLPGDVPIVLPGNSSASVVLTYIRSGYSVSLTRPIVPPAGTVVITTYGGTIWGYHFTGIQPYMLLAVDFWTMVPVGTQMYFNGVPFSFWPAPEVDEGSWSPD